MKKRNYFSFLYILLFHFSIFSQSSKYCGIWLGYGYSCYTIHNPGGVLSFYNVDFEVLLITPVDSIHISALKITGDTCVPKNNISWQSNIIDGSTWMTEGNPLYPAELQSLYPELFVYTDSNHIHTSVFNFVKASCGQIDSLSINIDSIYKAHNVSCTYYCPSQSVIVPNIFTPNGDGINDDFFIFNKNITNKFDIEIYNRWGEKIFNSDNINFKWNGTNHNMPVSEGTYFYTLTYIDRTHLPQHLKGYIMLMR